MEANVPAPAAGWITVSNTAHRAHQTREDIVLCGRVLPYPLTPSPVKPRGRVCRSCEERTRAARNLQVRPPVNEPVTKQQRKAQAKRKAAAEIDKRDRAKIRGTAPHTVSGGLPTLGNDR